MNINEVEWDKLVKKNGAPGVFVQLSRSAGDARLRGMAGKILIVDDTSGLFIPAGLHGMQRREWEAEYLCKPCKPEDGKRDAIVGAIMSLGEPVRDDEIKAAIKAMPRGIIPKVYKRL